MEREFNPDAQLAQAYGEIVERLGCDSLRYYKDLLCARQLSDEEKAYYQDSDEASLPTEFLEESNGEADVSYMDDSCSDGDRSDDDRSDEEDQAAFVAKASEIKQEDTSTLNCILLPSHRNSLGNKEGAREAE